MMTKYSNMSPAMMWTAIEQECEETAQKKTKKKKTKKQNHPELDELREEILSM